VSAGELGLAPLFTIAGFDGSLSEYVDALYAEYRALVDSGIRLWGRPLVVRDKQAADGRDVTFWHMVTDHARACYGQTRWLSPERCAMIPRVRDVLERLSRDDVRVCWWRERKNRVLVVPVDFSLVVRLRRVGGRYVLESAWPIDRPAHLFERAAGRWAVCESWPAPRVAVST
jgi:hypothetical protein